MWLLKSCNVGIKVRFGATQEWAWRKRKEVRQGKTRATTCDPCFSLLKNWEGNTIMSDQWIFFSHAQVCEDINFLSCVMTRSVSKNVFLLNIFGAVEFQASTWNGFVKSRFRTNRIYDGGCSICAIFYLKARPALRMHGECYQQRVGLWKMNARWKGHERKLMQFFKKHDRTWMAHDMRLRCNMQGHEWVQSEG